ncbi:MAG: LamG-like jellyroll fold domain-containing protein [Planctomycetota bacterium]|jgi:hypothetical protein
MKTVRMLVITVLVLVGLGEVARSQTSTHVYGADDPAVDVQAVQEAVDTYDIVYLHDTFDFEGSRVYIKHSVEILGEGTDVYGEYLTRIKGGGQGALSSIHESDVEWAVRDIELDGAVTAILTQASKRLEVTGCNISLSSTGAEQGIRLNGNRVTGSVIIEDNYIDVSGVATSGSMGIYSQSIFADIEAVDNTVKNFFVTGLWLNSAGSIKITHNTIIAGPAGPTGYRNGILVGSWFLPSGDRGDIEVTDNTIITGGHQMDQGITAEDSEQEDRDVCRVEGNVITYVDNSLSGFGFLVLNHTSNWTFKDNTINGGGYKLYAGIALYPGIVNEVGIQEGNVFSDNVVFNADFVVGGVFVDSSAHASDNEFVGNEFEQIGGDGFLVDGDWNRLLENKLGDVTGDGIILKGDRNLVRENAFHDIGGQHIVNEGVGNVIGEGDPALIAHWALDETQGMIVADSAGDNNGYALGDPFWKPDSGQVDGALQLDGIDDYVLTGFVINPADGPFSILVWVNGGAPGQVVVSQQGAANWLMADAEGNLMTELKSSVRIAAELQSQTIITDSYWHRIGFVWDGTNRILYVDDVAVAQDKQEDLRGSEGGLYIGTGKALEAGTYFSDLIDDVRIYNKALNKDEIAALTQ